MNAVEQRTLQAFKNQVGHARQHGLDKKSRKVSAECRKLDACIARLMQTDKDISLAQKVAFKGKTIKLWRRRLRNRSLRPLAYAAKADLKIKLVAPHAEASNDTYIQ